MLQLLSTKTLIVQTSIELRYFYRHGPTHSLRDRSDDKINYQFMINVNTMERCLESSLERNDLLTQPL